MHFLTISVLCVCACFRLVSSQALASWMTNIGPAVVWQNSTTNDLMYTIATGEGPGTGGYSAWAKLPITTLARPNTLLGATGFTGGDGNIYSYVYYISAAGYIAQGNFDCAMPAGTCALTGLFDISSAVGPSSVNNATGLAASQRTGWDGYRVLYHDEAGLTREVRYSYFQNITQWSSSVEVVAEPQQYVGTVTMDLGNNLTAYSINGTGDIIPSALTGNNTWTEFGSISTSSWAAWDPSNVTISATVDPNDNLTKSIFYIGTDRSIHEIDTTDNWKTQTTYKNPGLDIWPLADSVNARFTATNDSSGVVLSLFYISNGELVCASRANGTWGKSFSIFQTLPTTPSPSSTAPVGGTSATASSTPPPATSTAAAASNNGAKIGAGVGVGVGVPVLAGLIFLGYWLLRKKRTNAAAAPAHEEEAPAYTYSEVKPKVPDKDPNEMSPDNVPRHEMGGWDPQYELPTEGHGPVYEAPGHDVGR